MGRTAGVGFGDDFLALTDAAALTGFPLPRFAERRLEGLPNNINCPGLVIVRAMPTGYAERSPMVNASRLRYALSAA